MSTNITTEKVSSFLVGRIQTSELLIHEQVRELKSLVDALAEHVLPINPYVGNEPQIRDETVTFLSSCIAPIVDKLREQAGILSAKHDILRAINPTND